jgi:hypothetical protein
MEQTNVVAPAISRKPGRIWIWIGILVLVGGIVAVILQYTVFKQLMMPWYAPALATLGVLLVAVATFQRPTFTRGLILAVVVAATVFEWYALVVLTQLPAYAGPARVGEPVPVFSTTLANGDTFSDRDLQSGDPAVLLFFRGRW